MSTTTAELSSDEVAPFIVIVIVTLLFVSFLIWLLSNSLVVVRHAEVMIVERWGKYYTTLKPGLHWLWPFMDSPRQVKWRYSKWILFLLVSNLFGTISPFYISKPSDYHCTILQCIFFTWLQIFSIITSPILIFICTLFCFPHFFYLFNYFYFFYSIPFVFILSKLLAYSLLSINQWMS